MTNKKKLEQIEKYLIGRLDHYDELTWDRTTSHESSLRYENIGFELARILGMFFQEDV